MYAYTMPGGGGGMAMKNGATGCGDAPLGLLGSWCDGSGTG